MIKFIDKYTSWVSGFRTYLTVMILAVFNVIAALNPDLLSTALGLDAQGRAIVTIVLTSLVPVFYSLKKPKVK